MIPGYPAGIEAFNVGKGKSCVILEREERLVPELFGSRGFLPEDEDAKQGLYFEPDCMTHGELRKASAFHSRSRDW